MFSLLLLSGNFDLIKFGHTCVGPLKCGAPVRPNMFKHSLTQPRASNRDSVFDFVVVNFFDIFVTVALKSEL